MLVNLDLFQQAVVGLLAVYGAVCVLFKIFG